jgi:xanthine dehydrogenase accessory factor
LDIHFQPLRDATWIGQCLHSIAAREPFSINVTHASDDALTIEHWPEPKLLIIGHGATVASLSKLARQMDLTVEVLSPDQQLLDGLREDRIATSKLEKPDHISTISSVTWTAIVFLFHDHDWEIALMAHALAQPHFYLGAMGGRKAHAFRTEALNAARVSAESIATIHSPIGLFHSSRDPDSLALSTLGQVIESYHQQDFGNGAK